MHDFRTANSAAWISPNRVLKGVNGDQLQITFNPANMSSAGIIYFSDTASPNYLMSFIASRVKIQWVAGPTNLFFDFVGRPVVIHAVY
jgi:hypothetical protein